MRLIKVDAIESTNTFLKELIRDTKVDAYTCVQAHLQTAGRGQMGTVWNSKAGENLTCSVFVPIDKVRINEQFYISMSTALAIYDTLQCFLIPKIQIKWPNDILSEKKKVCGVLIENVVAHGRLTGVILGIGLNVNQVDFEYLPQASSMKNIMGKQFQLEELVYTIVDKLKKRFEVLERRSFTIIQKEYESILFRKNKPSTFKNIEGESFVGIIKNVSSTGKLQVLLEDEQIEEYDLKEIKLLY